MTNVSRRRFLELAGVGAGVGAGVPSWVVAASHTDAPVADTDDRLVRLTGDGLGLTAAQYSRLLLRVSDEKGIAPDSYSLGGVVEELEAQFARVLGKERA